MDKATTPQQLSKLDVNSKESLKESLMLVLKQKVFCARVMSQQKPVFRKECRDFLVAAGVKIYEKSLSHKITCAVASIVPASMINARSISEKRMEMLVQILFE